jgi:hypothetical protein
MAIILMLEDEDGISLHYYNSWFFGLGFIIKKYAKVIGVKKTTMLI